MPLRSPPGICWAPANGSPEIVQEFVICESSRNPHCQLVRRFCAATPSPSSHTCSHCFPFPARHSRKPWHRQCALASSSLASARLLTIGYQWLNIFGFEVSSGTGEEGSPVDASFYFVMIIAGFYVLLKRQVRLS